jgi:hypothetical protein
MPHTLQPSAVHLQPFQPVRNTARAILSTPRRVSFTVAGVFLIILIALLIANRRASSNESALQPAGAHISGGASTQSYNAATAPDTAATGTDPPPGTASNHSSTHVEVNGKTIPLPANGNSSSTTTNGNSSTTVNVSNHSTQSSSGTSTSSTENLNVTVNSSSHSSGSSSNN